MTQDGIFSVASGSPRTFRSASVRHPPTHRRLRHARGLHSGSPQNPFFLLLSKVTLRYGNRGGFLGSLTIGFRTSLPSANVIRRKRSSPSCIPSICGGGFAMGTKLSSLCPVPPANWPDDSRTRLQPPYLSGPVVTVVA